RGLRSQRHLRDGHLQRLLGLGALLPHFEQHVGRPLIGAFVSLSRRRGVVREERLQIRGGRPRGGVNRSILPPRPDFFGDERQKRCEQTQQDGERSGQCCVGRRGTLAALFAVPPSLHQLEVIVAEPPEERLRSLQRARVVVALERLGRLGDE